MLPVPYMRKSEDGEGLCWLESEDTTEANSKDWSEKQKNYLPVSYTYSLLSRYWIGYLI